MVYVHVTFVKLLLIYGFVYLYVFNVYANEHSFGLEKTLHL